VIQQSSTAAAMPVLKNRGLIYECDLGPRRGLELIFLFPILLEETESLPEGVFLGVFELYGFGLCRMLGDWVSCE